MSSVQKLTYEEFLHRLARRTGGSLEDLDRFLHRIGPVMDEALRRDGALSMAGFGQFELRHVEAHAGTNPQTGAKMAIPDQAQVHFSPFQRLRLAVNWPYRRGRVRELRTEDQSRRIRAVAWAVLAVALLALLGFGLYRWRQEAPRAEPVATTPPQAVPDAAASAAADIPRSADATAAGAPLASATNHRAVAGDSFWALSERLWGAAELWPLLYVENRDRLPAPAPDRLPTGLELRIPATPAGAAEASAGDRRRLQDAYKVVAADYRRGDHRRSAEYERVAEQGVLR